MSANPNAGAAPRAPYGSDTILRVGMQVSAGGGAPVQVEEDDLLRIVADIERFWELHTAAGGVASHDAFLRRVRREVCRAGRPDEHIPDDLLWERHAAKLECISAWFASSTIDFTPAIAKAQQVCAAVRALGEACAASAGGSGGGADALLVSEPAEGDSDSGPKPQEILYRGVLTEMHRERVCRWGEDTYTVVYAHRNLPPISRAHDPAAGDTAADDLLDGDCSDSISLCSHEGEDEDEDEDEYEDEGRRVGRRVQFDTRSMRRGKPVRVYVNEACSRINTNPELYRVSVDAGT